MGWGGLDSAEVTNNLKTSRINSIKVSHASVTVQGGSYDSSGPLISIR